MPGTLASLHVLPPSRVTLIKPLFVPTQIKPGITVESDMDWIAELPPGTPGPPAGGAGASFRIVRSGLSWVQWPPPSVVDHTDWNPATSMCWFHGAKRIGWSLVVRRR